MPTIDDDVVIDNLNQVVYSLAEDDMQECIRLFLNLYIDIDSELSFNVEKSGIVGSGKVIVSNINVISDQAQFVVSVSQLTVSNNVQMGARGGNFVFTSEYRVNIGLNLSTAGHAGRWIVGENCYRRGGYLWQTFLM